MTPFRMGLTLMFALGFGGAVAADEIRCGNHVIDDELINPPTKSEIQEKCGQPHGMEGNNWIYKPTGERQGQGTKVLHFDGNGNLAEIRTQSSE